MATVTVQQLRQSLRLWSDRGEMPQERPLVSLGIVALDQLLPQRGIPAGSLVEWLSEPGSGAQTLAAHAIPRLVNAGRVWCVVDPAGSFSLAPWSKLVPSDRVIVIRPPDERSCAWALEQILQCPAVGTTWYCGEQVPERVLRRWQQAAKTGGGLGMLFRSPHWGRSPPWSDIRWRVIALPSAGQFRNRRWRVELAYARGGVPGESVELEQSDEPHRLCLVP